jgi:glucose/arabinose dehydrogenase
MSRPTIAALLFALAASLYSAAAQPVTLVNAFPNLTFTHPVLVTHAGDGTNRVFVVQQNGVIRVFANDSAVTSGAASTFLNITARLSSTGGEEGLLGLAFHPDYASNGYFYVNYTAPSPLRTVVSRFSVMPGNPNKADSLSETVLLTVNQPFSNHNGGMLLFGNDGYLYISLGDGGSGGDPNNNAQNVNSLLGKILRIDVDTTTTVPYGIPPDNPFVGVPGADEIYALGLRNPWRCSIDRVTGRIWIGDVGQGTWEEVDTLAPGRNYGWRCYEGNDPYNTAGCSAAPSYVFPVKQYSSASPNPECSVTGGYIYRGSRRPDLTGAYIYGDYCSGKVWKLRIEGGAVTEDSLLVDAPFSLSAFGIDETGELYLCDYTGGTVRRFAGPPPVPAAPVPLQPADGVEDVLLPVAMVWAGVPGATSYRLQVATDSAFVSPAVDDSLLTGTSDTLDGLAEGSAWFWRVRASGAAGEGPWSLTRRFTTADIVALDVAIGHGWNLISLPATVAEPHPAAVFPGASSPLYGFSTVSGYGILDTLAYGSGYWLKFDSSRTIVVSGGNRPTDTIAVEAGWNLVGSVSAPLDTASVVQIPPGNLQSVFFEYDGTYAPADTLRPAHGYWVRAGASGQLILGGPALRRR